MNGVRPGAIVAVTLAVLLGCSSSEAPGGGSGGHSGSGGGDGGAVASGGTAGAGGSSGGAATGGSAGGATDSGALPGARPDELCGRVPGGVSSAAHVLRFESDDPAMTVQIDRSFEGQGAGHSSLYDLAGMAVVRDGRTRCMSESVSYTNSHHNWADRASATAEGVRHEVAIDFEPGDRPGWRVTFTEYDATTGAVLSGPIVLVPTGGPTLCFECPSHVDVLISEVVANNRSTHPDSQGEFQPWIELFNPSSAAVDLTGWTLSNDLGDRSRWAFPAVTIERHGYLVVFADAEPEQGSLHTSFSLAADGGALVLTTPRGVTTGGFAFGPQEADASYGLDGTFEYRALPEPTPGQANPGFD